MLLLIKSTKPIKLVDYEVASPKANALTLFLASSLLLFQIGRKEMFYGCLKEGKREMVGFIVLSINNFTTFSHHISHNSIFTTCKSFSIVPRWSKQVLKLAYEKNELKAENHVSRSFSSFWCYVKARIMNRLVSLTYRAHTSLTVYLCSWSTERGRQSQDHAWKHTIEVRLFS